MENISDDNKESPHKNCNEAMLTRYGNEEDYGEKEARELRLFNKATRIC